MHTIEFRWHRVPEYRNGALSFEVITLDSQVISTEWRVLQFRAGPDAAWQDVPTQ